MKDQPNIFSMTLQAVMAGRRANCDQCGTEARKIMMPDSTVMDQLFHVQVGRKKQRCLCLRCLLNAMQDESFYKLK